MDFICIILRNYCTADHDFCRYTLFFRIFNNISHFLHRRRHQGRKCDNLCVVLDCSFYDFLFRNVLSEVDDLKAVVFQHQRDEVLADIVDIPRNRRNDNYRHLFRSLFLQKQRLQNADAQLHRLRTRNQLR